MTSIKVGDVFEIKSGGVCKVIEYASTKDITIQFQDQYKHQRKTQKSHLVTGSVKNPYAKTVHGVGFLGHGKHKPYRNKEKDEAYDLWSRMMNRCYSEKQLERQQTYKDCFVCEQWHNFQNFADWYYTSRFVGMGYELDKDIVNKGNKEYSPENCRLVPKRINTLLNNCKASRGDYPIGVSYSKNEKKFHAQVRVKNDRKSLGYFKNEHDAFEAYKRAKEAYVKEVAVEYKGIIDADVYEGLMEWEVSRFA